MRRYSKKKGSVWGKIQVRKRFGIGEDTDRKRLNIREETDRKEPR